MKLYEAITKETLYPLLGLRRRLQIERVLKQWRDRPPSKAHQFRRRLMALSDQKR